MRVHLNKGELLFFEALYKYVKRFGLVISLTDRKRVRAVD